MAKTKDGLPRRAFAYAPTADPSSWKLPYLTAAGAPDPDHLPGAAAAVSEGGFRGQKADIPASAIASVKRRLRGAYRKWKGADAELPESIREVVADFDGTTIREAVVLLDKSPVCATVIQAPNGDTLVIPQWTGAFDELSKPYVPYAPSPAGADYETVYDVEDASDALRRLVSLKQGEQGETADVAALDRAIGGVIDFIRAETSEIGEAAAVEAFLADPANVPITEAAWTQIHEVGKRNSKKDQAAIQAMHDYAHEAGATHAADKKYAGMAESDAEPADVVEVRIEATATPEKIKFRESAAPGSVVPTTLREAAPLFDIPNKTVWVTPIRPGWGNKRDNNYYPASALREATEAGHFNHVKMYMDHPRKSDEKDLPERSVKDWFATTREAQWDDTRQEPRVPITVHSAEVLTQWAEAPEQVAFSVLGGAMARPGSVEGRKGRIVESIAKVGSVDWVTEAGAGGAIAFAESAVDEEFEMDLENLTAAQLREANPKLYAAIAGGDGDVEKAPQPGPTPTPSPTPTPTPTPSPVAEAAPAWFAAAMAPIAAELAELKLRESNAATATAIREAKAAAATVVSDVVKASTLTANGKTHVAGRFADAAVGDGQKFATPELLKEAVAAEIKETEALLKPYVSRSNVTGLGATVPTDDGGEKSPAVVVRESLASRFDRGSVIPAKDRTVFTAEEVATGKLIPVIEAGRDDDDLPTRPSAGASAAAIGDGSHGAQDRIAARMGV